MASIAELGGQVEAEQVPTLDEIFIARAGQKAGA
jgi:hypothetical protein